MSQFKQQPLNLLDFLLFFFWILNDQDFQQTRICNQNFSKPDCSDDKWNWQMQKVDLPA